MSAPKNYQGAPQPLAVNEAGIPDALKREGRWLMWRYVQRDGRFTKVPCQPNGAPASTTDPRTWSSFATVMRAYRTGQFAGVGFVLGNGWAGVDVDNYVGHESPLFETMPGYHERSPSGNGIKVIGRARRIGGEFVFKPGSAAPNRTAWSGPRYFAITGQEPHGNPWDDLTEFLDNWFGDEPEPNFQGGGGGGWHDADKDDDETLLARMLNRADELGDDEVERVRALLAGDARHYGNDRSRADQAFCNRLAYWANYDMERVDRMFRASRMYRNGNFLRTKWNTASYRRSTLRTALKSRTYAPQGGVIPDAVIESTLGLTEADLENDWTGPI